MTQPPYDPNWQQYQQQPSQPGFGPTPHAAPKKPRTVLIAALVGLLAWFGGCGTGLAMGADGKEPVAAASSSPAAAPSPTGVSTYTPSSEPTTHYTEPAAEPSPDGTYTGSCDYELGEFMADDYTLTGEVDVENTGNVGIVVKVKITWPQYGTKPIKETKKVRVAYGKTKTVQFRRDASGTEIDRLQTWQTNHGFEDGCKYSGRMLDTYGQVHS